VSTHDPRPAGQTGDPLSVNVPAGPPPTTPAPAPAAPQPARRGGRRIGRTIALALLVFVTVVLVLFVMFNTRTVDISLVFTDVRAPLVVALLIAAVLGGAVVGLLDAIMTLRGRRRSN
jgi:uncharacterized integral membrane protein